jgi:hypothetical protein
MINWDLTTLPLTKIFWSILAIEIVGFGVMMILAARSGGHTPEGPVGGELFANFAGRLASIRSHT